LTVRDIAKREGLTPVYVAKILVTLRRAGLVKSVRGLHGGYRLSRPAQEISVGATLASLGHMDTGSNHCKKFSGALAVCTHIHNCGIRPVLGMLTQYVYGFLNKLSLDQLVQDEAAVTQTIYRMRPAQPPINSMEKRP